MSEAPYFIQNSLASTREQLRADLNGKKEKLVAMHPSVLSRINPFSYYRRLDKQVKSLSFRVDGYSQILSQINEGFFQSAIEFVSAEIYRIRTKFWEYYTKPLGTGREESVTQLTTTKDLLAMAGGLPDGLNNETFRHKLLVTTY